FSTHSLNLQSPPSTRLPKDSSPLKQPSSTLKPPAHALYTQTNGVQPHPPRTHKPIQSQMILSASSTGLPQEPASPTLKKKKLKRRHSEVEQDAPKASPPEEPKPSTEHRQKKRKKKKRKRELEDDGLEVQRECVPSHLEPHQDEDWCLGETWSISSEAKGKEIKSSKAAENCPTEPQSVPPPVDPVLKKKKKHKLLEQLEELRNGATVSKCDVVKEVGGPKTKDLEETRKKKKKRKHKDFREEEEKPRNEEKLHRELQETNGDESPSQMGNTDAQKPSQPNTAAVFVWDSQVQDGYKRKLSLQEVEGAPKKGSCSAPIGWDGKKSCDVVEELLKNSSDKAYGTEVLSWDGDPSAISRDARDDVRDAINDTVLDEWDREFDSGKVKKMKKYKKEKRRNGNVFQKIQERRSMWSVTPGGRRSSLGFRH
ncbi:hypothetical protein R3I94_023287, partial [Phoxinus phoxinus]